ncbi:MAG TPA: LLM class flavin-dependent oxidoreductase [Acidimicrobiales bacterium]|nr:LLM class flavin-dependent oxidoreductase [Acidimicrobiales bacterium]
MRLGIYAPQGWFGEFDGVEPAVAWARSVEVVRRAEARGADSVWAADHLDTMPDHPNGTTFESHTTLTGMAGVTDRVELGQLVACVGFRRPALLIKATDTLHAVSRGRAVLGVGAGWYAAEWERAGFGPFPAPGDRLAELEQCLVHAREFFPSMVDGGPRVVVGGNGPKVNWRLAARLADELNLGGMAPGDVAHALPVIASRCEEIGRDPATLPVSVWVGGLDADGDDAVDVLRRYADVGASRVMVYRRSWAADPPAVEGLFDQAVRAGTELIQS